MHVMHFHRWTKWGDPIERELFRGGAIYVQWRTCKKCNRQVWRHCVA